MEKSILTPDVYPLSLNALMSACNQKSSREPVVSLDQGVVQRTVNDLVAKKHVLVQNLGSRVDKYQQRFCNTHFAAIQLSPAEFAVVCLLLLRGPQTPGELRTHAGRLAPLKDVGEVEAELEDLMTRPDGPFVAKLPREPGRRESRYMHLFCGSAPPAAAGDDSVAASLPAPGAAALADRVAALEAEVAELRSAVESLKPRT